MENTVSHNTVKHIGVITGIKDGYITVAVDDSGDCSGCSIRMFCSSEKNNVDVPVRGADGYAVGERVEITAVGVSRFGAMWMCVLLPCILLLAITGCCIAFGMSEPVAAVVGLLSCVVYYVLLYVFRRSSGHDLEWTITKL